jgi:hypothetical protein
MKHLAISDDGAQSLLKRAAAIGSAHRHQQRGGSFPRGRQRGNLGQLHRMAEFIAATSLKNIDYPDASGANVAFWKSRLALT